MKKLSNLLIITITFLSTNVFAQADVKVTKSNYVRPSLSIISSSKSSHQIDYATLSLPGHIDVVKPANAVILIDTGKAALGESIKLIAKDFIETNFYSVGSDKMSFEWVKNKAKASQTQNQSMSGKSTMTGNEAQIASTTGSDIKKDLYNKFYFIITRNTNIKSINEADKHGFEVQTEFAILKIDNAYEFILKHYQTMKMQNKSFKDIESKFKYSIVLQGIAEGTATEAIAPAGQTSLLNLVSKPKTDKELKSDAENQLLESMIAQITRKVEDFQIVTPLTGTNPITALVGTKEGLKIDNRYYAYDFGEEDSSGNSKKIYIGTVRVRSVTDNKNFNDSTPPSVFYKIGGGRLDDGMLIQNKEDLGIGLTVGYGTLSWIRADYRIKGITPGLKAFIGFNPYPGKVEFDKTKFIANSGLLTSLSSYGVKLPKYLVLAFNAEVGLEKTMMLSSRFAITPFASAGVSMVNMTGEAFSYDYQGETIKYNWDAKESTLYTAYSGIAGLRANVFLSANLSLVGTIGYALPIMEEWSDLKMVDATDATIFNYYHGGLTATTDQTILADVYKDVIKDKPASLNGTVLDFGIRYEF